MEDAGGAKSEEAAFFELFVPGRLCLFGEHSDWAGAHRRDNAGIRPGRTLVAGTQQGLFARCRRLKENVLKLTSVREDGTLEGPFEVRRCRKSGSRSDPARTLTSRLGPRVCTHPALGRYPSIHMPSCRLRRRVASGPTVAERRTTCSPTTAWAAWRCITTARRCPCARA